MMAMRYYCPKLELLNEEWKSPQVQRVNEFRLIQIAGRTVCKYKPTYRD